MEGKLVIRLCNAGDESAYIKLNLAFMHEVMEVNPYWSTLQVPTKEELKDAFDEAMSMSEKISIYVAEVDGEVIGYANIWTVYSIWSRGKALIVDDLYVAKEHRRNGIGEKMMKYLLDFAEQNGYRRVQLHAESDNGKAHALYRKMGFNEEGMLFFMKRIEPKE